MALKQVEDCYDDQRGTARRITKPANPLSPGHQLFGQDNALGGRSDPLKQIAGRITSLTYVDMVALCTSLTVSLGTSVSADKLLVWAEQVLERK